MWHLLEIEGVHHLSVSVVLGLSPLDRSSGILEPVNDVVDVQRLLPLPGLEPVEDADVLLDLEARGVIVLGKPGLQLRDLVFRIKANPHPRLVLVTNTSRRFHLDFSLQIIKSGGKLTGSSNLFVERKFRFRFEGLIIFFDFLN